ncbi:molybdopterin molybdotransferase MoeA [Corynebacterium sp.]|uniref:molybdopterin molybdotransferase MoeA n=1 Tax=Corynebacterium sp. TaxID=1720 RepID=UPI0028A67A52|nr:molybdopterin molybdotransferase MoeA [Corynebacterium sp.]
MTHTPVTWDEARARVLDACRAPGAQTRTVRRSPVPGDVTATPVTAPVDVPHYTSSAMDGFAVNGPGPWALLAPPVTGAHGRNVHNTGGALDVGQALPVVTGSLLPDGTTAVVRSENSCVSKAGDTDTHGSSLTADYPGDGRDIRPAGQEWACGETLVDAGVVLGPGHCAMLAVCGVDEIELVAPPRVACAFTGNEVIDHGVPAPGEVRDAFGVSFPALLTRWGADIVCTDRVPDDPVAVEDWLRRPDVQDADLVVMTGGSGRSGQDFARRFITRVADDILADEVACQPAHPTLIIRRSDQLVFGVPGNPFAAHAALHSFVAPAVAVLSGRGGADGTDIRHGTTTDAVGPLRRDRVRLLPARLNDGELAPVPGAHSHMLSGYAVADALMVAPAGGLSPGGGVRYIRV